MNSSVSVRTIAERHFHGRIARTETYHARMIADVIEIYVYDSKETLGFESFFAIRVLDCPEIKTLFMIDVMAMMGDEDAPTDDAVVGFADVDENSEFLHNYVMILRDMFPGYDVRRMDDGTFASMAADFKRNYEEHKAVIMQMVSKVSYDIADIIVKHAIPSWAMFQPLAYVRSDTLYDHKMFSEIEYRDEITSNQEYVRVVITA